MRIKINREKEETNIKIIDKEGNEIDFDYILMIELLYNEGELLDTEYCGDFDKDEKMQINALICEINTIINAQDQRI